MIESQDELLPELGRAFESLIPKRERGASIILRVNSEIKVPVSARVLPGNSAQHKCKSPSAKMRDDEMKNVETLCVCDWIHDAGFNQLTMEAGKPIFLRGVLSKIVHLVHQAHEKGLESLSTKDEALLEVCRGYHNPCKAFDDLKRRDEYKRLFDTRRRGFIAIRGAAGRSRNKSEARPE